MPLALRKLFCSFQKLAPRDPRGPGPRGGRRVPAGVFKGVCEGGPSIPALSDGRRPRGKRQCGKRGRIHPSGWRLRDVAS